MATPSNVPATGTGSPSEFPAYLPDMGEGVAPCEAQYSFLSRDMRQLW